ncbi:MAG: DUF2318 domain-containing protein [Chloroflexota bacterium]|nr:DUF2318 domain-containing protein [Chloroflexota bacterium]
MLGLLLPTLRSGLELAFILAMLSVHLEGTERKGLVRPLAWGAALGLGAAVGLTYGLDLHQREMAEGFLALLAAGASLGLIVWIGWTAVAAHPGPEGVQGTSWRAWILMGAASLALAAVQGLDLALLPMKAVGQATGALSPDQILKLAAVGLGLAVAALVGVSLRRALAAARLRWIAPATAFSLFILLIVEASTAVQVALVRGMLPLSDWLFGLMVPLVNYRGASYYILLAAVCALSVLAVWNRQGKGQPAEGLNPAQRRKLRAAAGRRKFLIVTAQALLALMIAVERAGTVYAGRSLTLSPPTPVRPSGGAVVIAAASVGDGKLHRFSYDAGGTAVRFLVIHKGSGVFGVALDACTFCGPAGYRQDGPNVICNRCGAAINIATIGLPGGCNPIPLAHSSEGDNLMVPEEALQAARGVFS